MSLIKEGGTFITNCDFCANYEDTDAPEFMPAIDRIKRKNWKVFKRQGEWFHKCDECQNKDANDFGVML